MLHDQACPFTHLSHYLPVSISSTSMLLRAIKKTKEIMTTVRDSTVKVGIGYNIENVFQLLLNTVHKKAQSNMCCPCITKQQSKEALKAA